LVDFLHKNSWIFGSETTDWIVLIFGYVILLTLSYCKYFLCRSWTFKMAAVFTISIFHSIFLKMILYFWKLKMKKTISQPSWIQLPSWIQPSFWIFTLGNIIFIFFSSKSLRTGENITLLLSWHISMDYKVIFSILEGLLLKKNKTNISNQKIQNGNFLFK
jgi:hypothetical protein